MTLPCSDESNSASSSMRASTRRLNSNITRARRWGFVPAQHSKAAVAAFTAVWTSSLLARPTRACTSPVFGLNTSLNRPEVASTERPSMKWRISRTRLSPWTLGRFCLRLQAFGVRFNPWNRLAPEDCPVAARFGGSTVKLTPCSRQRRARWSAYGRRRRLFRHGPRRRPHRRCADRRAGAAVDRLGLLAGSEAVPLRHAGLRQGPRHGRRHRRPAGREVVGVRLESAGP